MSANRKSQRKKSINRPKQRKHLNKFEESKRRGAQEKQRSKKVVAAKNEQRSVAFRQRQAGVARTIVAQQLPSASQADQLAKLILDAFPEVRPKDKQNRFDAAVETALRRVQLSEQSDLKPVARARAVTKEALRVAYEELQNPS